MEKDKRLMEASWWERLTEGETGSCLIGGAMLSKSLIQFSVDGQGCVPSLLFTWGQTKNWEYTEELYKKGLHDPDNHDGVITHLEPDILECKVKWTLGTITMNRASGGDGIPVELFQILKDDAVNVLHSTCQQIWKTQ